MSGDKLTVTERVQKFADEWAKLEKRGYDDTIHGLHFGTGREAELLASDLRALLAGTTELVEALREIAEDDPLDPWGIARNALSLHDRGERE